MEDQYAQVLQRGVIGDALAYSIKRGDRLIIYPTTGNLNIDNNPVENSIRPEARGYA